MSKCNIFMFIVVTIQLLSVNGGCQKKQKEDGLCCSRNVLCVKDVLSKIFRATKDIREMANAIEGNIRKKDKTSDTLQNNINFINKTIIQRLPLPTSKYYDQFSDANNIDRDDLVELFKEEHNAVSYLYNSINNLRSQRLYDHEYDDSFNKILHALQDDILCNYRDILRVYSVNWLPIHRTNGIQLLKTRKRQTTSFEYRSYAIIILKLSRQWMEKIEDFINNLENKLI